MVRKVEVWNRLRSTALKSFSVLIVKCVRFFFQVAAFAVAKVDDRFQRRSNRSNSHWHWPRPFRLHFFDSCEFLFRNIWGIPLWLVVLHINLLAIICFFNSTRVKCLDRSHWVHYWLVVINLAAWLPWYHIAKSWRASEYILALWLWTEKAFFYNTIEFAKWWRSYWLSLAIWKFPVLYWSVETSMILLRPRLGVLTSTSFCSKTRGSMFDVGARLALRLWLSNCFFKRGLRSGD